MTCFEIPNCKEPFGNQDVIEDLLVSPRFRSLIVIVHLKSFVKINVRWCLQYDLCGWVGSFQVKAGGQCICRCLSIMCLLTQPLVIPIMMKELMGDWVLIIQHHMIDNTEHTYKNYNRAEGKGETPGQ